MRMVNERLTGAYCPAGLAIRSAALLFASCSSERSGWGIQPMNGAGRIARAYHAPADDYYRRRR